MTTAPATTPLYRIGSVSKTTGVPVSTLRVWEARYGAFSPSKTEGQQRLYGEHDVSKALLLKQLSQAGHAISTIAGLGLDALRRMNLGTAPSPTATPEQKALAAPGEAVSLAVVGLALANRIESQRFALGSAQRFKVTHVLPDLAAASQAPLPGQPQVLLVKVNTLQASVHASIQALVQQHRFARAIVVYHFATEAVVQAMKFSGLIVRRDPISDAELAELLQSTVQTGRPPSAAALPASRKYSEETLSRVARISTNVLCECPRHVAELLSQLASFEQYSQECLSKSEDGAHLHAYLATVSGSARALFETALEKIAQHEGIDLDERAN